MNDVGSRVHLGVVHDAYLHDGAHVHHFLGWTAVGPLHGNHAITKPWVFEDHISGGSTMAFLVCMSMALARQRVEASRRWLLYGVASLALVNVLFVLQGRTGQVVAIGYMAIFVFVQLARSMQQNKRTRWITTMAAIVGCICVVCHAFMARIRGSPRRARKSTSSRFITRTPRWACGWILSAEF